MPTTLTNGIQLPDKGSVDWYNSMQSNYNLIDTHLGNTDTHVTAEDKANWNSKQGSLSQAQLDAIAQVSTNTSDIATLQSGKANASHTHSSSDITDIGDYATKQYVDNSISGLVDNAPAALDTLKELSTALNDDANFASTVATALSAKVNSADLATVATSGSYSDLSNKPSIPTKTSDLTNDSNFVDTSNSAVASGITSAKVTSYDSHVADTDIHVTTADKTKWNTIALVKQLRLVNIQVGSSTTIAFANIDDTNGIKVGDKCMDLDAKMFEITAVDTTNQTVTVGTALIDLALDANVVHTSGNETVDGVKTFTDFMRLKSNVAEFGVTSGNSQFYLIDKNNVSLSKITQGVFDNGVSYITLQLYGKDSNNQTVTNTIRYQYSSNFDYSYLLPTDNGVWLGSTGNRWGKIYGIQYYYGSNNVEFSTKFVTTDTAQTITGSKTFSSNINVYNSDSTGNVSNLVLKNSKAEVGTDFAEQSINFVDKNNNPLAKISCYGSSGNYTRLYITASDSNNNSEGICIRKSTTGTTILPTTAGAVALGNSSAHFYNVQTSRVNGLTPSSLSLPSNTGYVDISGYFTNTGDGQTNSYTASVNGWIYLNVVATRLIMQIRDSNDNNIYADMRVRSSDGTIYMTIPIGSGNKLLTQWFTSSSVTVTTARFIPCQGNI